MLTEDRYFESLSKDEIWERYCGFLHLTLDEFMGIQQELLMDQVKQLATSKLGKLIIGKQTPTNVEEFQRIVPLTSYDDYEPYLSEQQEGALAMKPSVWCHSAGRGGRLKWYPLSSEFLDKLVKNAIATFILATAKKKGQINIHPGVRTLFMLPPPPYASGIMIQTTGQHFTIRNLPRPERTRNMPFPEKIQLGFQMALKEGVDIIGSLPSILVRMGAEFGNRRPKRKFSLSMIHPRVLSILLKAWLRSKKTGRKILPKDLWPTKAIMVGGMDAHIYRDSIIRYWGDEPYQFYVSSEAFYTAMHSWNKRWMTFVPDMVFLEFIPYDELKKEERDKDYLPKPVLLNEVKEGEIYEVVISHFYGMPLLRYRLRDLIKIEALKDEESGINLPQMSFQRRADEAINLGGLAQLDEKTIWQAMENIGLKYNEWIAFKEFDKGKSFLRLFIELTEPRDAAELEKTIDKQLKVIDTDYKDIDYYLGMIPVRVTLLSNGTFQRYTEEKVKGGADPAHLKPAHINLIETEIKRLIELSEVGG